MNATRSASNSAANRASTAAPLAVSRPLMTTHAPCSSSCRAISTPIPAVDPVITATLPVSVAWDTARSADIFALPANNLVYFPGIQAELLENTLRMFTQPRLGQPRAVFFISAGEIDRLRGRDEPTF